MTRGISHQRMFLKALETLGGITAMEGTMKPESELNTYYNLSRDGQGDQGVGVNGRPVERRWRMELHRQTGGEAIGQSRGAQVLTRSPRR